LVFLPRAGIKYSSDGGTICRNCRTEKTTKEFSDKMGALMQYIESTYLIDNPDEPMAQKLRQSPITQEEKQVMNMGFDAIFAVEDKEDEKK
jgi:hypothetical protein